MTTPGKLRLIQCGVGGFGRSWLTDHTVKSPDFELAAIVDVSAEHLSPARETYPGVPSFPTLEQALAQVEADAVLTVTPPSVHAEHARLAFAHGLHLMTEKPFADTLENAREMLRLSREANRVLMVSQNYRFRPVIQRARDLIATQAAGPFGHGHLDFYIPADFTGSFREAMEYPLLIDMAIHHLDLIRCVTGQNIVSVTAQSFRPAWSWFQHEPGLKILLALENGSTFSYSGDWTARGRSTGWNGQWRLQCAEGSIHLERDTLTLARSERWDKNPTEEPVALPALPYPERAGTLHLFAEAIRTGQPNELSGENNLWSYAAVMAGVQSAQTGGALVRVADLICYAVPPAAPWRFPPFRLPPGRLSG